MSKRSKSNGLARPVRTKRDYENVSAVVKRLSKQADRDSVAERRLQSLLRELEQYDELEESAADDDPADLSYSGPRRRWSDNGSDDS